MAGLKDIKRRIKSVKNSKKITYAMKLVSAAKLKKAQDAVHRAREYTDSLTSLLATLSADMGSLEEMSHPLMEEREEQKKIRILVVGGSRGLCGGFNANLNKRVDAFYKELQAQYPKAEIEAVLLGKKPAEYFRLRGKKALKSYEKLPENANDWPIAEVCNELEKDFLRGEIDSAYIVFTRFRSAMSQDLIAERLLPVGNELIESTSSDGQALSTQSGLTKFEPSPEAVFQAIVPRLIRTKVRQAGLDTKASEYGSRMIAMDAATKNAGELVHKLTLLHNRLRQSKITAELLDIIGGAEAQN